MIGKVQRKDGQLIVVIPEDVAKAEGMEENTVVAIRPACDDIVHGIDEIAAIDPTAHMTLEEMCARITPENRHVDVDWGPPVGNEVW